MSDEYPKMVYRDGSEIMFDGRGFDTLIVGDAEAEAAALDDGWVIAATAVNPLDRDGDGKPGGSRKKAAG